VFDGPSFVVLLKNVGAPDVFKGTGQIVQWSRGDPPTYPFTLSWDLLPRNALIKPGQDGRVRIADRKIEDRVCRLNVWGDHNKLTTWRLGDSVKPTPVTLVVKVEFVAEAFPSVVAIRHYQLEATHAGIKAKPVMRT
jgi:hypothetical protein